MPVFKCEPHLTAIICTMDWSNWDEKLSLAIYESSDSSSAQNWQGHHSISSHEMKALSSWRSHSHETKQKRSVNLAEPGCNVSQKASASYAGSKQCWFWILTIALGSEIQRYAMQLTMESREPSGYSCAVVRLEGSTSSCLRISNYFYNQKTYPHAFSVLEAYYVFAEKAMG